MTGLLHRRGWLRAGLASAGALVLGACDKITADPKSIAILQSAEGLTRRAQRLLIDRKALAREFSHTDISPDFRPNGSIDPTDADYVALKANGLLRLSPGDRWLLVERPLSPQPGGICAAPAVPHPDHPTRLCGRLVVDR